MATEPKQVLGELLRLMHIEGRVDQFTTADGLLLHVESPEGGRLIGKQGQTLANLQFVVNRMLHKGDENAPHVIVDVCRYRERQRDLLIKHVQEQADRVRRWGDSIKLEPMSPYERRVVHQFFAADPDIETISEGDEEGGRKQVTLRARHQAPQREPSAKPPPPPADLRR
ncbi:MAG: KH domain-containing protein [Verrucomicrobia bacterium]|nr:KH domain-containing protein [Verrucomicrobiota bacterium]